MTRATLLSPQEASLLCQAYQRYLPLQQVTEPHLFGVIQDVGRQKGSMTRAQLSYLVMRKQGQAETHALKLSCGIEYFHTASLLLDDLPAMDDGALRRGQPCVHRVYGEAPAILGALALITRAYSLVWEVVNSLPWHERLNASSYLEAQIGAAGILNGQAQDLFFNPKKDGPSEVAQVAVGKTVSLIRLSLIFPALICGVSTQDLDCLEQCALGWGLAYQGMDDLRDLSRDPSVLGKTPQRDALLNRPNMALATNVKETLAWIDRHLLLAKQHLGLLIPTSAGKENPVASPWAFLATMQQQLEEDRKHLRTEESSVA
jgi:geranylgeranyl pyrophosphate synthase